MPIHDWTRVEAGTFHDFHQAWIIAFRNSLNTGGLPSEFFAMADQILSGPIPDIVEEDVYARRANRILIKHHLGQVVAVIEIVSPGNKNSRHAVRAFVQKAGDLLEQGIHLLIVDLFPPSPRDPQGIHKEIWDEIREEPFELPADKPLTIASYSAGFPKTAYVEPIAVADELLQMPIFLTADLYVPAPLEATYQATWAVTPEPIRELLEPPASQ